MGNISRRTSQYFELNRKDDCIDDITFNDLNLGDVFNKINKTSSSLGDEVLYYMLRSPLKTKEDIRKLEEGIQVFSCDSKKYSLYKKTLSKLDKLNTISVFEYLAHINEIKKLPLVKQIIPTLLMLLAIGICFIAPTVGVLLLLIAFIINTISYFKLYKEIKPYFICFAYIIKSIKTAKELGLAGDIPSKVLNLKSGAFILGNLSGVTAHGGSGNPLDLVLDLLRMGFHFDIIKFYSMVNVVSEYSESINSLLYEIGKADAYISIVDLRKELDIYCKPIFCDEKLIECSEIYHPLLNNPVKNSIKTDKSILLTGSNASGKSTFLRTISINTIFAQSINTVFGEYYKAPFFTIISSMDIKDSVTKGESFYVAEIKSVKRILDIINRGNTNVLCVLDELLKGTNTIERIAAAGQILDYINNKGVICFAATHDLELCTMLKNSYSNYHFEEDFKENDISFSYRLLEGKSKTTNAVKLLEKIEFPSDITEKANKLITEFETNNVWSHI